MDLNRHYSLINVKPECGCRTFVLVTCWPALSFLFFVVLFLNRSFATGLGQVQLKLGDFKSALSNFEKVLEVYPDNCETLKVS